MKNTNEKAELTARVLGKCADAMEPAGPWRWRCAVQNGARLSIAANLEEGFLHLACHPEETRDGICVPEHALLGNGALAGGVKLALDESSSSLRLHTDIAVLEEKQLFDRFWWAIDGFHDGCLLLKSPAVRHNYASTEPTDFGYGLGELLREAAWPMAERGPNDFTAELDADSATKARIRMSKTGVVLNLELIPESPMEEPSRRALALFLLTASSKLRLVRAYAAKSEDGWSFGMQVSLPAAPATEEINHALAALSVAHGQIAREARVLLDGAAACCYLAARDTSTTNDYQDKKEN